MDHRWLLQDTLILLTLILCFEVRHYCVPFRLIETNVFWYILVYVLVFLEVNENEFRGNPNE